MQRRKKRAVSARRAVQRLGEEKSCAERKEEESCVRAGKIGRERKLRLMSAKRRDGERR